MDGAFPFHPGGNGQAAVALLKLRDRISEQRATNLAQLVVITGGRYSYRRPDGVAVVPLATLGP